MAETPADNPETAQTLGARLRSERERRGLALHQVAQELHVDDGLIAALERDEYAALGVPIFVRGHLRNYAQLLGLPSDEVIAAYDHAGKRLASPRLVTTKPEGSPAARRAGLQVFSVIVIAVLIALAVVWWRHRTPAPSVSVAVHGAAMPEATGRQGPVAPAAGSGEVTQIPLPVPGNAPAAASRAAAVAGGALASQAGAAASPAAPAANSPVVQARFVVSQASWIEVYDASGKKLFYNLAPSGDKLTLSGPGPLQVFIGNAPGVSIELNGAPFDFDQYKQANNTARFSLGAAAHSGGRPG